MLIGINGKKPQIPLDTTIWQKVLHDRHLPQLYYDFVKGLAPFMQHSFIKRMQAKSYEDCKAKLNDNPSYAIIQFDFSQNMTCQWQDAAMSTHWHKTQITIFTCVCCPLNQKLCQVIILDERGHNKESVIVFLETLMNNLPKEVKVVDFWSDRPSSQFKNRVAGSMLK